MEGMKVLFKVKDLDKYKHIEHVIYIKFPLRFCIDQDGSFCKIELHTISGDEPIVLTKDNKYVEISNTLVDINDLDMFISQEELIEISNANKELERLSVLKDNEDGIPGEYELIKKLAEIEFRNTIAIFDCLVGEE